MTVVSDGTGGIYMENQTVGTVREEIAIVMGGSRGLGRNTAVNLAQAQC